MTVAGDGRVPFIDVADIAEVAIEALLNEGHHGATYDLSGPESLSFGQAAAIITAAIGRRVEHLKLTSAEFIAEQREAGVSLVDAESVANFIAEIGEGHDDFLSDGVQRVPGREPGSFADYVQREAKTGVWDVIAEAK